MARQARIAVILALGAGLALAGCGRKGPLERPGAPPEAATAPQPEPKPADAAVPGGAPQPTPKPGAAGGQ